MNKKIVGIAAIASSIMSLFFWLWYASIPSFDQSKKSFNQSTSTFQTEGMNNEK